MSLDIVPLKTQSPQPTRATKFMLRVLAVWRIDKRNKPRAMHKKSTSQSRQERATPMK